MIFVVILLGIVISIGVAIATFIFKMNKEMEVLKKYGSELDMQIENMQIENIDNKS